VTYDETFYLTAGKAIFERGDFDPCAQNGVAPLPVLIEYGPAIAIHGDQVSDNTWGATEHDPLSIDVARMTTAIVVGVPLLWLVVGWVMRRTGSATASTAAGLLVALSPVVWAHTSLATTDGCFTLFFLAALLAIGWHAANPSGVRFAVAGGLIGLAVASKYTGLVLFPVGYLVGALADTHTGLPWLRRLTRVAILHPARQVGLALVAGLVAWAVTGFEVSPVPLSAHAASQVPAGTGIRRLVGDGPVGDTVIDLGHRLRLPSPVVGAIRQYASAAEKTAPVYPTQLFGQVYPAGHRLYYVWSLLFKSTPAELVLFLLAGLAVVAGWTLRPVGKCHVWGPVAIAASVLFVMFSLSAKQFGIRYLLPLYPAGVVLGVTALHGWLGQRPHVFACVLAGLVGWQAASTLCTFPQPLTYVNDLAGGPGRGHEALGNSDVDWGQGLIALNEFLQTEEQSTVLVKVLGNTPPAAYGVQTIPWKDYPAPPCRYIAIGATMLHRDPVRDGRVWPFRGLKPTSVVANSILIFDTTEPEVWRAYTEGLREYQPGQAAIRDTERSDQATPRGGEALSAPATRP
jgi:hypothetical protein